MAEGRPVLPEEEVHSWAAKFGLVPEGGRLSFVKELPSYDDLNFHIGSGDREYVLKAHNGVELCGTPPRLAAQNHFIQRLHSQGIAVPAVVLPPDGRDALPMDDGREANLKANIRVLTYLPGDLVAMEVPKSDEFLQNVGEFVGEVTVALKGFEDEGAKWDWGWHMKNIEKECLDKLSFIASPERQQLARTFIERYASALTPEVMAGLPHSVIHGDLNDTNLLFDAAKVSVVGVIDFGDSIYSCTVFEVGIAAAYYSLCQEDPLRVFREVLRGYLRKATLSEEELRCYYHAAYGRILLSACFSAKSCAAEPDNEYLAHTADPGWVVLGKLEAVSPEEALKQFQAVQAEVGAAA